MKILVQFSKFYDNDELFVLIRICEISNCLVENVDVYFKNLTSLKDYHRHTSTRTINRHPKVSFPDVTSKLHHYKTLYNAIWPNWIRGSPQIWSDRVRFLENIDSIGGNPISAISVSPSNEVGRFPSLEVGGTPRKNRAKTQIYISYLYSDSFYTCHLNSNKDKSNWHSNTSVYLC